MKVWDKFKVNSTPYNIVYFLKEVKTMIQLNIFSHTLSFVSIGLILFILAMMTSGWWASNQLIEDIQGESEISIYFSDGIDDSEILKLIERIDSLEGVREAQLVEETEAYGRMEEILGKEARVLELFDDNPFSAFIEVEIHLDEIDLILEELEQIENIEHVRDNREVLDRLNDISGILKILGYLVIVAAGISTVVIISHIIRLGIYNNREQINTLRLLGAPESFISLPFLIEGLVLTLGGGILAVGLIVVTLKYLYAQVTGPLPFIPLPSYQELVQAVITLIMLLSMILGITGSLLGISSSKSQ